MKSVSLLVRYPNLLGTHGDLSLEEHPQSFRTHHTISSQNIITIYHYLEHNHNLSLPSPDIHIPWKLVNKYMMNNLLENIDHKNLFSASTSIWICRENGKLEKLWRALAEFLCFDLAHSLLVWMLIHCNTLYVVTSTMVIADLAMT